MFPRKTVEHFRWRFVSLSMDSRIWTEIYSMHLLLYRQIFHPYNDENMAKNYHFFLFPRKTVDHVQWKFVDIETKPGGFKKYLKNHGKAPSFPWFWIFNKCLWKNTYYILKTKKWIKYNTGKVIYRKEIYRESKIWEKNIEVKGKKINGKFKEGGQKIRHNDLK